MKPIIPLGSPLDAKVRPPGSKSQTIRALVAAALAEGPSHLARPLDSDDTRFARQALAQLGVEVDDSVDPWVVPGSGGRLHPAPGMIDAGASGLTARLLIALASLVRGPTTVIGRDRLPERPMGGLVDALSQLGVKASTTEGHLPVTVAGVGALSGGSVEVASQETTQFLTGLLMTGPLARSELTVTPVGLEGSGGYVDVTVQIMREFGADIERVGAGYRVGATGYTGADFEIEPDASAAVYPMVGAAITGGRVLIEGLGSRSVQPDLGIARVLELMGCEVGESETTTTVIAPGNTLSPIDADLSGAPDGSLAVAIATLFAEGRSRLRGLGSLRLKESDRLATLATEIRRLGAGAEIAGNDLIITPGTLHPARIETYGDHRIAMSFALVGLVQPGIEISDPDVVAKTWPGYWEMLDNLVKT